MEKFMTDPVWSFLIQSLINNLDQKFVSKFVFPMVLEVIQKDWKYSAFENYKKRRFLPLNPAGYPV
jgi:hypothetical protein